MCRRESLSFAVVVNRSQVHPTLDPQQQHEDAGDDSKSVPASRHTISFQTSVLPLCLRASVVNLTLHDFSHRLDLLEDVVHHLVRRNVLGLTFEVEDHAVPEDGVRGLMQIYF